MRHFCALLFGDVIAFWWLWDIPMTSRLQPEAWEAEWLVAVVLGTVAFVVGEVIASGVAALAPQERP